MLSMLDIIAGDLLLRSLFELGVMGVAWMVWLVWRGDEEDNQ